MVVLLYGVDNLLWDGPGGEGIGREVEGFSRRILGGFVVWKRGMYRNWIKSLVEYLIVRWERKSEENLFNVLPDMEEAQRSKLDVSSRFICCRAHIISASIFKNHPCNHPCGRANHLCNFSQRRAWDM